MIPGSSFPVNTGRICFEFQEINVSSKVEEILEIMLRSAASTSMEMDRTNSKMPRLGPSRRMIQSSLTPFRKKISSVTIPLGMFLPNLHGFLPWTVICLMNQWDFHLNTVH